MAATYLRLWEFFGKGLGRMYHLTVAFMLWYARRMYLYEEDLPYDIVRFEFLGYIGTVLAFFWMTSFELRLHFAQFYNKRNITYADL